MTPARVGNSKRREWQEEIRKEHNLDLHIIEREEIITLMMMPENASTLCRLPLSRHSMSNPRSQTSLKEQGVRPRLSPGPGPRRRKGIRSSISRRCRLDPKGANSARLLSLEQIYRELSQSGRIVLEAARRPRKDHDANTACAAGAHPPARRSLSNLPSWATSGRSILEYIAEHARVSGRGTSFGSPPRAGTADGTPPVLC